MYLLLIFTKKTSSIISGKAMKDYFHRKNDLIKD